MLSRKFDLGRQSNIKKRAFTSTYCPSPAPSQSPGPHSVTILALANFKSDIDIIIIAQSQPIQ